MCGQIGDGCSDVVAAVGVPHPQWSPDILGVHHDFDDPGDQGKWRRSGGSHRRLELREQLLGLTPAPAADLALHDPVGLNAPRTISPTNRRVDSIAVAAR